MRVVRLRGLPARLGVRAVDGGYYLATDRLWVLDGSPLQRAFYGTAGGWPAQGGACATRTLRLRVRTSFPGRHGDVVVGGLRGRRVRVEVQRSTVVTGRTSLGLPQLGRRMVATGAACAREGRLTVRARALRLA